MIKFLIKTDIIQIIYHKLNNNINDQPVIIHYILIYLSNYLYYPKMKCVYQI